MRKTMKKAALVSAVIAASSTMQVQAANWLMLQGTEPEAASSRAMVWGFTQPSYLSTSGTTLPNNLAGLGLPWREHKAQFNVHQPDLVTNRTFQLMRTQVGVRGVAMPIDPKVNYFILTEWGHNGVTEPGGGSGSAKLTDATVTLNHIPGMRIRVGQMKVPMSEEMYQGIIAFNYINLTNIANQQLVERPLWTDGSRACALDDFTLGGVAITQSSDLYLRYCNGDSTTQFRGGTSAVRDNGVQFFDTFDTGGWESSYALLIGNGGINKDNRDGKLDRTLYLSTEKVFAGEGPFRQGFKAYAWSTSGKRTIYSSVELNAAGATPDSAEREYDRKLKGVGFTFRKDKYRLWAEYIKADGMIFNGSTVGSVPGDVALVGGNPVWVSQFIVEPEGEANGGYIDFGYRVTKNLELDYRYDWYNRVTNGISRHPTTGLTTAGNPAQLVEQERRFVTHTFGIQYFFNARTKLLLNYEKRTQEAPNLADTHNANLIGDAIDNRYSAQIFAQF